MPATTRKKPAPAPPPPPGDARPPIILRGVRTHNLRGVDCDIPAGALTVITGLSGSGKSSLAFDTLFAEGQRRFVESLSTYARQFLARMARPDADLVDHIPPAIALEQKNSVRNARSTVGTATEINDYLRLLFGKAGEVWCDKCGVPVTRDAPPESARRAATRFGDGARLLVLAPIPITRPTQIPPTVEKLRRDGFTRLMVGDDIVETDDPAFAPPAAAPELFVVVDRVVVGARSLGRLSAAIESAYRITGGTAAVTPPSGESMMRLSAAFACNTCGAVHREPDPRQFNFNNPLGACATCQGFGRVTGIDWSKVIPDPRLSLKDGAIAPWRAESGEEMFDLLATFNGKAFRVPLHVPFGELTPSQQDAIRLGQGDWPGVKGYLGRLEKQRHKVSARITLARYRSFEPCPECAGARVGPDGRAVRFQGRTFGEIADMSIRDLDVWFAQLELPPAQAAAIERPLSAIRGRLRYLVEVGLGYLTLARATRTLSGGESQRINLATALGGGLTDTLYVLDEPTVGLHASDTDRLIRILAKLVGAGNTVVVVEHDLEVIRAADKLIDIGPGAGEHGGRIVYQGHPSGIDAATESSTRSYLESGFGRTGAAAPASRRTRAQAAPGTHGRRVPNRWITVEGAHENNLRHVTAQIPLGVLCAVTGLSGSGKSSLIKTCLYGNWCRERGDTSVDAGRIHALHGLEHVGNMLLVDQAPLARSARSNAATFLKAYDGIRSLLAGTRDAQMRGIRERDFSFNVEGGRCPTCEGTGRQTIEMVFLADVEVVCEKCEGRRFQDRILDIRWQGLNVTDVLDLTVARALEVFGGQPRIQAGLRPLAEVGLSYLRLGQSTSTLSGGEAQRLKIAAHLAEAEKQQGTVLIFDEPTTGLHPADLDVLLATFQKLIERGFSLIVIEHNIELIRRADHVIDMGPGGGDAGGSIVAEGTPEQVAAHPDSLTGKYILRALGAGK